MMKNFFTRGSMLVNRSFISVNPSESPMPLKIFKLASKGSITIKLRRMSKSFLLMMYF